MADNKTIHLIYTADDRFAMPLAVSLFSVLDHLRAGIGAEVYIVDGGFRAASRSRIEKVAHRGAGNRTLRIHWVKPDPAWWNHLTIHFHGTLNETVLYRLGIPRFVAPDVRRAVYLDADVLAKSDLCDLVEHISDDDALAAVRDYGMATWAQRYATKPDALQRLGVDPDAPYFNAGILGINVDYWRRHDVADRAAQFLVTHAQDAGFYDQDALNHTLVGQWRHIGPEWNFSPTCRDTISRRGRTVEQQLGETYEAVLAKTKMVHFTGAKPWNQGYTNPERPAFMAAMKASGWYSPIGYRWWLACWYGRLVRRGIWKSIYWRWIAPRRVAPAQTSHASATACPAPDHTA